MEIGDICYDSRRAKAGDLFVAITGFETDGHRYIGS
ncbi:MAG: Mur ligase domain-containing protein, partial [Oscillospiraceae bacterium]